MLICVADWLSLEGGGRTPGLSLSWLSFLIQWFTNCFGWCGAIATATPSQ